MVIICDNPIFRPLFVYSNKHVDLPSCIMVHLSIVMIVMLNYKRVCPIFQTFTVTPVVTCCDPLDPPSIPARLSVTCLLLVELPQGLPASAISTRRIWVNDTPWLSNIYFVGFYWINGIHMGLCWIILDYYRIVHYGIEHNHGKWSIYRC